MSGASRGVAPDGSPVDLYARMPTYGEPELIHEAISDGTEILELGSGAGRMTHRLLELGHRVTAVDNSAEMLARIRGAETVEAEIVGLDLGRRFGCVLMASNLVNHDDDRQRAGFLATCARHVAADGVVLIQRYDPAWAADPQPSENERGGVRFRLLDPSRDGERLTATVEYELDGQTWRHGPFTSRILGDAELDQRLGVSGLIRERWLDDRRSWLSAMPAPDISALYLEVPEAEALVGEHRLRWDASAAAGIPAHVTILYPFLDPADIGADAHAALTALAAAVEPFELRFSRAGRFPDVAWLAPEPVEPLMRLTDAVVERWPSHPPYGGAYETVVHHLTVAEGAPEPILARLEGDLQQRLPIVSRVTHLTLAARQAGTWRDLARYELGAGA